jgi:hypothetical protein
MRQDLLKVPRKSEYVGTCPYINFLLNNERVLDSAPNPLTTGHFSDIMISKATGAATLSALFRVVARAGPIKGGYGASTPASASHTTPLLRLLRQTHPLISLSGHRNV